MRSHGLRQHLMIIFATIYTKNLRIEPGKTCGKRYRLELLPPHPGCYWSHHQDDIPTIFRVRESQSKPSFVTSQHPGWWWETTAGIDVSGEGYLYSLGWGFFVPRSLWSVSGFLHYRWWWYVRSRYIILSMLHFVWCYIRPWQHLSKLNTQLTLVPPLSLCLRGVFIFGLLTLHFHIFHLIQVKADNKETHAHQAMEKIWTKLK